MKFSTETFLNSKRVTNYASARNIELLTMLDNQDEDDLDTLIVSIYFKELKDTQTQDDCLIYRLDAQGLFFVNNYQVDGLSDLPYWIESYDQLKELINYMSEEGK